MYYYTTALGERIMPIREPSDCLHKATGQASTRLDGRMVYLGAYNSEVSLECYKRAKAEWLAPYHIEALQCISPFKR